MLAWLTKVLVVPWWWMADPTKWKGFTGDEVWGWGIAQDQRYALGLSHLILLCFDYRFVIFFIVYFDFLFPFVFTVFICFPFYFDLPRLLLLN